MDEDIREIEIQSEIKDISSRIDSIVKKIDKMDPAKQKPDENGNAHSESAEEAPPSSGQDGEKLESSDLQASTSQTN